jgi:ankyrin repeat protein
MDEGGAVTELFRLTKLGSATNFLEFVKINYSNNDSWGFVRQHKSGNAVAHVAAECGHVSILSLCSDVHLKLANRDGKQPLHIAAQVGHVDCVGYLLSRHVDVDCFKRADWYVYSLSSSVYIPVQIRMHIHISHNEPLLLKSNTR